MNNNFITKRYDIDIRSYIKKRLEEDHHYDEPHNNSVCITCQWAIKPINLIHYGAYIIVSFENGNSIKIDIKESYTDNDELSYKLVPDGIDCDRFSDTRTRYTVPVYFNDDASILTRYNGYVEYNNNSYQSWFNFKLNENYDNERRVFRMCNYVLEGTPMYNIFHNSVFQIVKSTFNNHRPQIEDDDDDLYQPLDEQLLIRLDMGMSIEEVFPSIIKLEYPLHTIKRICEMPRRDEIAICEKNEGIHIVDINTGVYTGYLNNNASQLYDRSILFDDICCTSTTLIGICSLPIAPYRDSSNNLICYKHVAYMWDINTREYKGKNELGNLGYNWTLGYSDTNDMGMIISLDTNSIIILYEEPLISREDVKNILHKMTPFNNDITNIICGYTHGYLI